MEDDQVWVSTNVISADKITAVLDAGKLADIAVSDLNLMKINPKDILIMNRIITIVNREILFNKNVICVEQINFSNTTSIKKIKQ